MGVDPDDNAAAKVIAQRLSPEKQKWFDSLALRGAHEYAVELERENTALREQLGRQLETLTALKNCQNKPVCGHCNALLRAAVKEQL